jgi:hypothetical protein
MGLQLFLETKLESIDFVGVHGNVPIGSVGGGGLPHQGSIADGKKVRGAVITAGAKGQETGFPISLFDG